MYTYSMRRVIYPFSYNLISINLLLLNTHNTPANANNGDDDDNGDDRWLQIDIYKL